MENFSLILGGWSARGIAHIGIIRRLEELDATPVCIVWTSMGAIIGTFYACGYSSKQMEEILLGINFLQFIDPNFLHGGIKGNKIITFLKKYLGETSIEQTKIPLKIISTDINTGEVVVFESGKIIDAIRASISIPGIFTPFHHHWAALVDGGIVANLPIEFAPENTKVIAVSVMMSQKKSSQKESKKFFQKTPFSHTYTVLRKAVGIMIAQNESRSIQSREGILLIHPERDDIEYYDFKKIRALIQSGYSATSDIWKYLDIPLWSH